MKSARGKRWPSPGAAGAGTRRAGRGLSEGQLQRLSIARAIYDGAPILLLDECTSALDEGTERQALENLKTLTDKTVIIVTHGKAALSVCDRVFDFSEKTGARGKAADGAV